MPINHTDPNSPKTDKGTDDIGVPMRVATAAELAAKKVGPEDLFDENPANLRGNYAGRKGQTEPSYTTKKMPDGTIVSVRQDA